MTTAEKKKYAFHVLGVSGLHIDTVRQKFFSELWQMLDVEPPKLNFHWVDEDLLFLGDSQLQTMYIRVPDTPATGHIVLWVDDLVGARRALNRRCIPILDGLPGADLRGEGFKLPPLPNHNVEIWLTQAPPVEKPSLLSRLFHRLRRFR